MTAAKGEEKANTVPGFWGRCYFRQNWSRHLIDTVLELDLEEQEAH